MKSNKEIYNLDYYWIYQKGSKGVGDILLFTLSAKNSLSCDMIIYNMRLWFYCQDIKQNTYTYVYTLIIPSTS